MIRNVLRLHRTGFMAVAAIGMLITLAQAAAFAQAAGSTEAERQIFGRQMTLIAHQFVYLIPLPVHPETLGGYVQWRAYGILALVFGIWALLAAAGAVRGDEERGLTDGWLAAGLSRSRLVAARIVGFGAVAAASVTLSGLAGLWGAARAPSGISTAGLFGVSLALWALTVAVFALSTLVAQQAGANRSAAGAAALVLLVLFMLDSLSRLRPSAGWLAWITPFGLYDRTNSLAPGGRFDAPATLTLLAVAVVSTALTALTFARRDLGAPALRGVARSRPSVRRPDSNPWLGMPVIGRLWEQRWGLLWWALGTVAVAGFLVSVIDSAAGLFTSVPGFQYLLRPGTDPKIALLSSFWFGVALLLLTAFAVVQVAGWSAEDEQGRLELTLAQPVRRWRVVAERAATLVVATALIAAAGSLAVAAVAPSQGAHLDFGRLVLATALTVPVATAFGGVGALLAGWRPRLATLVNGAVAVVSYFVTELGPLFKVPSWVLNLSVFQLYGSPLVAPVFREGLIALIAVSVAGFALAMVALQRRDLGS